VILYEMIAGAPPFDGESLTAVVAAITADTPRPLAEACPEAPRALSDAVMRALCKRPDERFETVHAFAEAIAPFGPLGVWSAPRMSLSSSPRVSRADALDALPTRRLNQHTAKSWATGTLARRRRRTSRRALLSMALVLLAGAVAVLFFLQSRRGEPEPAAPEPVVEAVPAIPEEPAAEPEPEIATSAAPSASASAVVSAAPPASPVPARPQPSAPAPKPTPPVENPLTL
jgi:serine/threonine-protein kinase